MMGFIDTIMNKIKNSHVFKMISDFIGSFRGEGSKFSKFSEGYAEYTDTHKDHNYASADIGLRVARRVEKILKKNGKKFKNSEKATGTIAKIVNVVAKVMCVAATVAFGILVAYTIIKILPTIIYMVAMAFAVAIIVELILSVISNGCGVSI